MAAFVSAPDVAIRRAVAGGTLRLVERRSRLGGVFVSIEDERGLIEVANNRADADARILECAA